VQAGVAVMLGLGHRAFRLGCSNRPSPAITGAAAVAWALACAAVLLATLFARRRRPTRSPGSFTIRRCTPPGATGHWSGGWNVLVEILIGGAGSDLGARAPIAGVARGRCQPPSRARVPRRPSDHRCLRRRLAVAVRAAARQGAHVRRRRRAVLTGVFGGDRGPSQPIRWAPPGAAAEVLAGFRTKPGAVAGGWSCGPRASGIWTPTGASASRPVCVGGRGVRRSAAVQPRWPAGCASCANRCIASSGADGRSRSTKAAGSAFRARGRDRDARGALARGLTHACTGSRWGWASSGAELRADDLVCARALAGRSAGSGDALRECGANLSLDTMQRVARPRTGSNEALVCRALGGRPRARGGRGQPQLRPASRTWWP